MRLADGELAAIPGAAAWYDSAGRVIATTPEWRGATPGTASYCAGELTLLVSVGGYDAEIDSLCQRLVGTVETATSHTAARQRLRLQMVAASLRVVLGRYTPHMGSCDDVMVALHAALELANPPVALDCDTTTPRPCPSPDVVALALKQLITNAQRHAGATALSLLIDEGPTFRLRWRGRGMTQPVATSRHPSRRARWGAGFVRLAADAVGAVVYDPLLVNDGRLEVAFAIQPKDLQLRLPLALVDADDTVMRATRSWDEETHALPGQVLRATAAVTAIQRARISPHQTAVCDVFAARTTSGLTTWVGMVPADSREQAADLVTALAHEHDLLRVTEPHRTRVLGLAAVIGTALGRMPEPWDPGAVVGPYATASAALDVAHIPLRVPPDAPHAPDPLLTAFLVSELGGEAAWDATLHRWLLDGWDRSRSPAVATVLTAPDGRLFLS